MVQSLLDHRADPNWRDQVIRRKASDQARRRDNIELVIESLREILSDVSPLSDEGEVYSMNTLIARAKRAKEPLEDYKPYTTALQDACTKGRREEITALLEAKADPCLKDAEGNTALHTVMQREEASDGSDHAPLVRQLLDHKALPNAQNKAGDTPLHLLVGKYFGWSDASRSPEAMEMLVEAKADITLTNQKGNTVLHVLMERIQAGISSMIEFYGSGARRISIGPLEDEMQMRTALHHSAQRSLHARILLTLDALPADEMIACMPIKNKAGIAPERLFSKLKIPVPFLEEESSTDSSLPASSPD